MMMQPLDIEVDVEANAGYVTYSKGDVAETVEIWKEGTVAADLDSNGNILGIEVLGFDEEVLSYARAYARERNLEFPARFEPVS